MPKVLTLDNKSEKRLFLFVLSSLNRPLAAPKVLTLDNKSEKKLFLFVLSSLNRTFAQKFKLL